MGFHSDTKMCLSTTEPNDSKICWQLYQLKLNLDKKDVVAYDKKQQKEISIPYKRPDGIDALRYFQGPMNHNFIIFENCVSPMCTKETQFLMDNNRWCHVIDFEPGDKVKTRDGKCLVVKGVVKDAFKSDYFVYDNTYDGFFVECFLMGDEQVSPPQIIARCE